MPGLRSPLLLCGAGGRLKALALFCAACLFLWMFLAADPLEQLADCGRFGQASPAHDAAYALAASWRHGMAGNSPLYLPGFFAIAAAAWVWSERRWSAGRRLGSLSQAALLLIAAAIVALALAPAGAVAVFDAFKTTTGVVADGRPPGPRLRALLTGLYTLLTWGAFVVGSRMALSRRSLMPLAPVPVLTAGLLAIRPWTLDDFALTWGRRSLEGDPFAIGSLVAMPVLAIVLVTREQRRSQPQ